MDEYRTRLADQLPEIRKTVRRLGGSYGLSDDVTQECCVRILEQEGLWKGRQAEGWMGVISRNLTLRLRGRAARMRAVEKPLSDDAAVSGDPDPMNEERIRWVLSQFASLPTKQREVLKMRYFENLSNAAVAEKLGVSEPTVSIHHARALETLKGRAKRAGWVMGVLACLGSGKGKAAAAAAILATAGGLTAYFFTTDPDTHLIAKTTDLKRTLVTPHMGCPMEAGKNVLYCATFQLAWDELKELAGGKVALDKPWDLADKLNAGGPGKKDLPDGSYVAMAGFVKDGIKDRINAALEKTFRQGKDPFLEQMGQGPSSLLAYAFLSRDLGFRHPLGKTETVDQPFRFGTGDGQAVRSFGFEVPKGDTSEMLDQIRVYGYDWEDSRKDFVVALQPTQEGEEIILAHMKPRGTLQETVQTALSLRQASKGVGIEEATLLKIPLLDFDVRHDFQELVGNTLDIPAYRPERGVIATALQTLRFKLDEKGSELRSRAVIEVCLPEMIPSEPPGPPARPRFMRLVFDDPFLLLLKRKDSAQPYFALWVDNAEVLVGEKKTP